MRSKRLARRAALCYTVGEIRAARRAVRDIAVYRTYCRTEKKGRHIRAAKRQIEPRSARLPEARISKPHPRKGTETGYSHAFDEFSAKDFKTTSPQGDGNLFAASISAFLIILISKPHPRKGTETIQHTDINGVFIKTFQNHIPARGRKLHRFRTDQDELREISKPHPRKGTETFVNFALVDLAVMISKPHPRKGTETPSGLLKKVFSIGFKTTSPQGDGNPAVCSVIRIPHDNISKPHPRKGTETLLSPI